MSDPTYRIDVEHEPGDHWPFMARVYNLASDEFVWSSAGATATEALESAQAWIAGRNDKRPTFSLFVDDDGQRVEAHSVKAS